MVGRQFSQKRNKRNQNRTIQENLRVFVLSNRKQQAICGVLSTRNVATVTE